MKHQTAISRICLALVTLLLVCAAPSEPVSAEARSRVYINGVRTSVYFSDGDTFRVHSGEFSGSNTRIAGFNALESFGPAHQWGDWHPYELYINSKQATVNGRRGVWHCTSDGSRDGYGRILMDCPDLAIDQLQKGLAHAMTITDDPSPPEYLRAQQEAIRNRRGMWAHGVPRFVMTSAHSMDEYIDRDVAYNRRVSTLDGHSEVMEHTSTYEECSRVCSPELRVDPARVAAVARSLREDRRSGTAVASWSNIVLKSVVDRYARQQAFGEWVEPAVQGLLRPRLENARAAGEFGTIERVEEASCFIFARFERRYGRNRAHCFRDHGIYGRHGVRTDQ